MPKVLILPHYSYEREFANFLDKANAVQSDFKFYLLPPVNNSSSPLREPIADYLEILGFLDNQKKQIGLDVNDLLIAFYDGVITALDHGLMNLFIAGANAEDLYPCTAAVSLQFISWGILEQKYDYSLQRHALFHLVMCSLIGGYTKVVAHNQTYGCLLDFNNDLVDFNRKLQMGYYLCSDRQSGCYDAMQSERYGNSIIRLCGALKEGIDHKRLQIVIKEITMGDRFDNIHSATIINRSLVEKSFNKIRSDYDEETANALKEVAAEIEKLRNKEAAENFDTFNEELQKQEPKKAVLRALWGGVTGALPSILQMTDAVTKILKLIGS